MVVTFSRITDGSCCCGGGIPPLISPSHTSVSRVGGSFIFPMPASVVAGHLGILMAHAYRSPTSPAAISITGWALQYTVLHHTDKHRIHVWTRRMDGTESGSTILLNPSGGYDGIIGCGFFFPTPTLGWDYRQATSLPFTQADGQIDIPQLTPVDGSYLVAMASNDTGDITSSSNMPSDCGSAGDNIAFVGGAEAGMSAVPGGVMTPGSYWRIPGPATYKGIGLAWIVGPP